MANSSCYTRTKFNIIYIIGRKILFPDIPNPWMLIYLQDIIPWIFICNNIELPIFDLQTFFIIIIVHITNSS